MFIASGILYGITTDDDFQNNLKITFALDLYTDETYDVNLDLELNRNVSIANYDYTRKVNIEFRSICFT